MDQAQYNEILSTAFAGLPREITLSDSDRIRSDYERNVTALRRHVPLVLKPRSEAEVQDIVLRANASHVPLYPLSTGKNWGLGSKLPVRDNCVVVDLSAMKRIREVNTDGRYAIIESGVTQADLADYLRRYHPQLTMNITGSFAQTSLVGNVLERGDGSHARIDDLLGVKGILGNGEPFAVGGVWEHCGHDKVSHASRYAAGPDLVGMFSQSNFGVITHMAFRLRRRADRRYVFWGTTSDNHLERLVYEFDRLSCQGIVNPGGVNIGYANRFLQAAGSLIRTPTTQADDNDFWNFYALVEGTARVADATISDLNDAFAPFCESIGQHLVTTGNDPLTLLPPFLHPLAKPLIGIPDNETIKLVYSLTGTPLPNDLAKMDVDKTPFGMKCYIPLIPAQPRHVRRAAQIVSGVRRRLRLNTKISFFGDGRTLITIHFNVDDADQVRRAEEGEKCIWDQMIQEGYLPYRAAIDQMDRLIEQRPEFFRLVQSLKSTFDPNHIISPGRYCPEKV